ncbi:MAG TPA: alanine racemase, partial [Blastocatellia bacterium]|nr:alanine racemase [Blastocatellia bacterium]
MPAVKAEGYGHGAIECARALEAAGADWFGVALPEEGLALRDSGITRPILCLGGFWDGQEELIIARDLTPTVFRIEQLAQLSAAAEAAACVVDYHLKVDTGMGRLGVPYRDLEQFLKDLSGIKNVRMSGLMTHIASADDPAQKAFTEGQIALFEHALAAVRRSGHNPEWVHQANSATTVAYPRGRGNLVRIGGLMYGIWRDATSPEAASLDLRPVMSLRTQITLIKSFAAGSPIGYGSTYVTARESLIATLPIGYSDGLRRALSNKGQVIVRGELVPVVGRISMDLTTVDVTDVPGAKVGDEVIIFGNQGLASISAEEVACKCGTIAYEITCQVGDRVPRIYRPSR